MDFAGGNQGLSGRAGERPGSWAVSDTWKSVLSIAVVLAVGVLLVMMFMPALGKARNSSSALTRQATLSDETRVSARLSAGAGSTSNLFAGAQDRRLVRTASLSRRVDDIEQAANQAAELLRAELGEYASDVRVSGSGGNARGSLTLRPRVQRLESVLDGLRTIGEMREFSVSSEDVTDQLVDLDARIRNEQRIESELLELLDARSGDELKQVLELRRELGGVRESIERLQATRDSLEKRVALATVYVELRGQSTETRAGFLGLTGTRMSGAWSDGLDFTSRTIAGFVGIAVGGSVWWFCLALVGLAGWRIYGRGKPEQEPASA